MMCKTHIHNVHERSECHLILIIHIFPIATSNKVSPFVKPLNKDLNTFPNLNTIIQGGETCIMQSEDDLLAMYSKIGDAANTCPPT